MKLLYAGSGVSPRPYTQLLFNCLRNQNCEREFYVPVNLFSDIVFYTDLPGKPSAITFTVYNVCASGETPGTAVSNKFVVGKKPDGSWYGVFGKIVVTPPVGVTYDRFFFKVVFTISGVDYTYYSQQYEFPWCDNLVPIRGCYPDAAIGSDAEDCNGIYYGFANNEDYLGSSNYRYIHTAFLRDASVIEQTNKMSFTAFNNKKVYRNNFVREHLLEFELVPTFFKDILIGIFNRGNIQIDTTGSFVEWKLAEEQSISIIDNDSKLWRMDMLLDSECKQTFGCGPSNCVIQCTPVSIVSGTPLPDAVQGQDYSHIIFLTGTTPLNITIVSKPSWMTLTLAPNKLFMTGTPPSVSEEPILIAFILNNECEVPLVYSDNINVTACTEIDWDEAAFPGAVANEAYSHDVVLTGSLPINLITFTVPSWMSVVISGNTLTFAGVPTFADITEGSPIEVNMTNCFGPFTLNATIVVAHGSAFGYFAIPTGSCIGSLALTDLKYDGVSVIPIGGSFPVVAGELLNFKIPNPTTAFPYAIMKAFFSGAPVSGTLSLWGVDSNGLYQCDDGIAPTDFEIPFFAAVEGDPDGSLEIHCGPCS